MKTQVLVCFCVVVFAALVAASEDNAESSPLLGALKPADAAEDMEVAEAGYGRGYGGYGGGYGRGGYGGYGRGGYGGGYGGYGGYGRGGYGGGYGRGGYGGGYGRGGYGRGGYGYGR